MGKGRARRPSRAWYKEEMLLHSWAGGTPVPHGGPCGHWNIISFWKELKHREDVVLASPFLPQPDL